MTSQVRRALACAKRGWHVHPVHIIEDPTPANPEHTRKVPYLTDWPNRATTDDRKIRAMWSQYPDAAVGVVTGATSNLYVVDVDDGKAAENMGLPTAFGIEVPTHRTGGKHIYFSAPADGKPVRNKADGGVDFRGDGGYVVAWVDPPAGTLVQLPPQIAMWARATNRNASTTAVPDMIIEGQRDNTLASLAGTMRRRGMSEDSILAALLAENAARCVPPLPDEDIERIAASVARYTPEQMAPQSLLDALASWHGDAPAVAPSPDGEPLRSRILLADDWHNLPEPTWLIEDRIPNRGVGQMFGRTTVGKTFLGIDLAMRIGNDHMNDWFGAPINRHGMVLYVLMEGLFDWVERTEAWHRQYGGDDSNLAILPEEALQLGSLDSLAQLVKDIELLSIEPVMLIVDTQHLATTGTNEDSNTDMGSVMLNMKQLSNYLGCVTLLIHHPGHNDQHRARGAYGEVAALDFQLQVTDGALSYTKMKAAAVPDPARFKLEVPIGASSPVVIPTHKTEQMLAMRATIIATLKDKPPYTYTRTSLLDALPGARKYGSTKRRDAESELDLLISSERIVSVDTKKRLAIGEIDDAEDEEDA